MRHIFAGVLAVLSVVSLAVATGRAEQHEEPSVRDSGSREAIAPGDDQPRAGDAGSAEADAEAADTSVPPGDRSRAVDERLGLDDGEPWIFIDKSERRMVANDGHGWREAFRVALGSNPVGDKRRRGDGRTPEGEFFVCMRFRSNRFHRFIGISYPSPEDAERGLLYRLLTSREYLAIRRAARRGWPPPWDTELGGNIGIHGYGFRRDCALRHARGEDWTDGCIGVTNEEIDRIYAHAPIKTRVVIVP